MPDFPRRIPVQPSEPDEPLVIDCATCVARHSDACDDCVVTFLCSLDDDDAGQTEAVVLDLNEIRALKALGDAGLVPTLRHRASG